MCGHLEAASAPELLHPGLYLFRGDLLDESARLAHEMVVVSRTAKAEGLFAFSRERIELTGAGEDRQRAVDGGETGGRRAVQLVVQLLSRDRIITIAHGCEDGQSLSRRSETGPDE